jgi:hypothetical protein
MLRMYDVVLSALDSTVLAIAEGSRSRGKNRFVHYARGAASMDDTMACPDAAVAHGYIAPLNPAVREKMKRVVGTLVISSR